MTVESSTAHLVVRVDHVLCTVCFQTEPVTPGGGTPMPAYLAGLAVVARRHPKTPHKQVGR